VACKRLSLPCEYPVPGLERKNRRRKSSAVARQSSSSSSERTGSLPVRDIHEFVRQHEKEREAECQQHSKQTVVVLDHSHSLQLAPNGKGDDDLKQHDLPTPELAATDINDEIDDVVFTNSVAAAAAAVAPSSPSTELVSSHITEFAPVYTFGFSNIQELERVIPPSPTPFITLNLDDEGHRLFEYFCSRQAKIISVSPENSFLDVFVPMASESDAVLYGIVAWAGFHKDRGRHQEVGYRYLNKAMQAVVSNFNKGEMTTLAGLLLILAGEICNGDVVHWNKHLSLAAKIINMNGGLSNFVNTRALQWLATNFAYHDLLAASTCARRNTHFLPSEYDQIMRRALGPDTLLGCCQPLFQILAEISDLAVESQQLYCDSSMLPSVEMLKSVRSKAVALEQKIVACIPDHLGMITLSPQDLERQLTLFETFQLAAKIHLFQSVLRLNACSLDMQCLSRELLNSLDVVLGTDVEAGLVFPLFIAGISCYTPDSRQRMLERFDQFYERNLARNIRRTRQLLEEVWKRDEEGSKHVDWYGIIESRGWDLCFA
jgi:transcriptional activator protein UGA3